MKCYTTRYTNTIKFCKQRIVETITTIEVQRSNSPIQSNFTTPKLKNPTIQQTITQSLVKPSIVQKKFTNDLPNISTSNKTIIQTTQKKFCRTQLQLCKWTKNDKN